MSTTYHRLATGTLAALDAVMSKGIGKTRKSGGLPQPKS